MTLPPYVPGFWDLLIAMLAADLVIWLWLRMWRAIADWYARPKQRFRPRRWWQVWRWRW